MVIRATLSELFNDKKIRKNLYTYLKIFCQIKSYLTEAATTSVIFEEV